MYIFLLRRSHMIFWRETQMKVQMNMPVKKRITEKARIEPDMRSLSISTCHVRVVVKLALSRLERLYCLLTPKTSQVSFDTIIHLQRPINTNGISHFQRLNTASLVGLPAPIEITSEPRQREDKHTHGKHTGNEIWNLRVRLCFLAIWCNLTSHF